MKRKNPIFSGKFAVLAALAALPALSGRVVCGQKPLQQKRDAGTVQGTIRNAAGEVIADAKVRMEGRDSSTAVEVKSGTDGRYSFPTVAPGTYTVTAEKSGWKKATSPPLFLSAGETKQVDLRLEVPRGVMEFDDRPNFSVAGVTDWNNAGIHGSDTNQRTGEALVKETLALKPGGGEAINRSPKPDETERELKEERARVKKMLASAETADSHGRLAELEEPAGGAARSSARV